MALALACEDSRMSMDSDLSNLSPCKPIVAATKNNSKTSTITTSTLCSVALSTSEEEEHTAVVVIAETALISNAGSKDPEAVKDQPKCTRPSWADIIEEEERVAADLENGQKQPAVDSEEISAAPELVESNTKMSMDDSNSNTSLRSSGSGRQIEIDILDSSNVEKYEKLVRDEKIKSPFKRRLSVGGDDGDDDAAGDDDGHAKFVDAEPGTDENLHKKTKMSEDDHGRERFRRESSSSSSGDGSSQSSRKPIEYEKDASILERRQKQIDYGKNTLGYENYSQQVPRDKRTKDHPKTPPKHIKYSRRAWDGLVKVWRKQLHCFDPDAKPEADV